MGRACEDPAQQASPVPEKKRTRNIGSKSRRMLIHNEDVLELRLTWEEAQDLLRPPPCVKPGIVTVEGHIFEEYDVTHTVCFSLYLGKILLSALM